jgi:hypothetical protein
MEADMQRPHVMSGGRYPVLRSLAIIYVVGAALAALATLVTLIYIPFSNFAWTDKLIMFVGASAAGFFLTVGSLALAEVLKLFIDVEHNTRMSGSGARTMVSVGPGVAEIASVGGNGPTNRLDALDEETAEAALIRGH